VGSVCVRVSTGHGESIYEREDALCSNNTRLTMLSDRLTIAICTIRLLESGLLTSCWTTSSLVTEELTLCSSGRRKPIVMLLVILTHSLNTQQTDTQTLEPMTETSSI